MDNNRWLTIERGTYLVFVDNIPDHITKRFLYMEFGIHGNVVDVFISRKPRKGMTSMFAFVRYDSVRCSEKAIQWLDGLYIAGKVMIVNEAKYGRNMMEANNNGSWKQIEGSILAECFEPIKFGVVVEKLEQLKEQLGKIECRDLGPRKCILSLDSVELRDRALSKDAFCGIFDEVRAYWGFKWSMSRRVWVELMGIPIHIWSEDTFRRIARGLDGKFIMLDGLTEKMRSFSIARLLLDCFQWESIQEWVSIKCEEVTFDVYVKEIRGEVLSAQVHPDQSGWTSTFIENSVSPSMASMNDVAGKYKEVEGQTERLMKVKEPLEVIISLMTPLIDYWGPRRIACVCKVRAAWN
ncbi:hypothetical protein PIB30_030203 [Stylosanthes scabra]|uniref:RRM domain-containing protein n=1 Tax=Stylosanthes scabra TaxID=79078 RepID=A0ABU6UA78_9FABA|nr:hypothetical protein [Stylosanthes scabra]